MIKVQFLRIKLKFCDYKMKVEMSKSLNALCTNHVVYFSFHEFDFSTFKLKLKMEKKCPSVFFSFLFF